MTETVLGSHTLIVVTVGQASSIGFAEACAAAVSQLERTQSERPFSSSEKSKSSE